MWGCRCWAAARPGSGWSDIAFLRRSTGPGLASRGVWVPPSAHVLRTRPSGRVLPLYFAAGGTHTPRPADTSAHCRWRAAMSGGVRSFRAPPECPFAGRAGRLGPMAERSKGGAIGPWPMAGDMSAAIGPKRPASRAGSPARPASRGGSAAYRAPQAMGLKHSTSRSGSQVQANEVLIVCRPAPQPRHRMPSQPSTHIQRPTA